MPWSYERNVTLGVVEVVYSGTVSAGDLRESTETCIGLEKQEGLNRFLVDATDMTLDPDASLLDIFNLPAAQYEEQEADRQGRLAVYVSESSKSVDVVRFYETACVNRGWMVKMFFARQDAVEWLTQRSVEAS